MTEIQAILQRDPALFCRSVLGVSPWQKQIEVLQALRDHDRVAVRSGHGTGKSFIASCAVLWFLFSFYASKVVTTAPTWNQVRNILWKEIRTLYDNALFPLGGVMLSERLFLGDNAFAVGLSTDTADRFQGYHSEHLLVILDEAPGVRPEIWEAAETLLTGRIGKILAIGNPTSAAGRFYECFDEGSGWARIRISCFDSPNLDHEGLYPKLVGRRWIEDRKTDWGENSVLWRTRVLGEFPDEEGSFLVPRGWLLDTQQPAQELKNTNENETAMPPQKERAKIIRMGVDVARHGEDATVFLIRDDTRILHDEEQNGWDTMQTCGRVVQLMNEYGISPTDIAIDDTGLGAGVTDRLKEQGYQVSAIVAASRADDPAHYINKRAEMFWRLREVLNPNCERRLVIDQAHETLRKELTSITYEIASTGAIRISEKTKLRAMISGSPNHADALALTYANKQALTKTRNDPPLMII